MTAADLLALLPFIVLAAAAVVVMLGISVHRHHLMACVLALAGQALAFLSLFLVAATGTRQVTPLMLVDGYTLFFTGLLLATAFAVTILSYGYLERHEGYREEYYVLLLLATLGSAVLVASTHFATFFLGLEVLSVSLYAMLAYLRYSQIGIEAGIKYLVLAATSSAFLLFGMALLYASTGSMEFSRVAAIQPAPNALQNVLPLAGAALLIIGIGFKLAVVPFHMWAPDIYEGAPAPVTAFVATVSKGGMFALLLRFFLPSDIQAQIPLYVIFVLIAVASMLAGNLLALLQNNIKRILAYSSIAHFGYLLVAFLAAGTYAVTAVSVYLVAYFVTTLCALGVVTVLSSARADADDLMDYRGLFWQHPMLAGILAAAMLSLAGIPMTIGFIGKFFVLTAGVDATQWLLVIMLVVGSAIGLFYYLRIIVLMYLQPIPERERLGRPPSLSLAASVVLGLLTLVLVWLGIYPAPLLDLIRVTAGTL